ncbi:tigger transposable element-derived protein 1 [Trichonephila clavipes]|nr:tigger transposable element-derived protein 1 [Trichonephila clavipes]
MLSPERTEEAESLSETEEIGNLIEKVVDFSRKIISEVDSNDVQELLDFHNQELTVNELIEMHEQDTNEDLKSEDPVQSENRMTVGNLTGLSFIEKGFPILENTYSNEERIF